MTNFTELSEIEKASKSISQLSNQLARWDGSSSKGAAIYDAIFDAEVAMDSAVENDRKYYGMNAESKQDDMDFECAETSFCNSMDDEDSQEYGIDD